MLCTWSSTESFRCHFKTHLIPFIKAFFSNNAPCCMHEASLMRRCLPDRKCKSVSPQPNSSPLRHWERSQNKKFNILVWSFNTVESTGWLCQQYLSTDYLSQVADCHCPLFLAHSVFEGWNKWRKIKATKSGSTVGAVLDFSLLIQAVWIGWWGTEQEERLQIYFDIISGQTSTAASPYHTLHHLLWTSLCWKIPFEKGEVNDPCSN